MLKPSRPPVTEKELREKLDELIARVERNNEEIRQFEKKIQNTCESTLSILKRHNKILAESADTLNEVIAKMKAKRASTLTFKADPAFIDTIQKLADEDGVTRAEIVRRAIGLYSYASSLAAQDLVLKPATPTTGDPPC
jgi:hypothetical protein